MALNTAQLLAVEYAIAIMGLLLGYKCISLKKDNMNYFMRFIAVLNVFMLENIPVRLVELHLVSWNRDVVFCLYAIAVVLMTFSAAYWCLFVLKQLDSFLVSKPNRIYCFMTPALISIILCIINYRTGWLYVIDENGWYARGSVFVLQAILSYGYIVIIIIACLRHLTIDKDKSMVYKCSICTIPSLFAAIAQIVFGGSYAMLGILITGWSMYIEICLDRQKAYELSDAVRSINEQLTYSNNEVAENMRTILALSDIYYVLYEVDFTTDTFKEIKAPEYVSQFCSQFTSARECMKMVSSEMFTAAYVGLMDTFFDLETINDSLKTVNSYYADAIGKHTKNWIRATMIVVEKDDDGNILRIVFSFQEIGDIIEQKKKIEEAKIYEIHANEMKELFVQTAEALASAIDAKDNYTHGHSVRVATYSKKIAELSGLSETECEKVYFAGLLHDVGKIGIPDTIICKTGKLTQDEYSEIKKHPESGKDILQRISRLPYLSIGANYHHERFDGKGYPLGLAGEDIPEMARIIAVADAYDAMTSKRSYRNPIPQQTVREELVKGMETQFDPNFAKIMIHLIDLDLEYLMKESDDYDNYEIGDELIFDEYRSSYARAIRISDYKTKIHFDYDKLASYDNAMPALVFFDSLDACIHNGDGFETQLFYHEYGELKIDGTYAFNGVRKTKFEIEKIADVFDDLSGTCDIEIVKEKDHLYFEMQAKGQKITATLALPDSTRFVYVCITGEYCKVHGVDVSLDDEKIADGTISRIAEEISFLSGVQGDLPSVQIDGWRSASTKGILIDRDKEVCFDMKSLPFARLLWHCPFIVVYYSDDGQVYGPNYKEYGLVRFDGEGWSESEQSVNNSIVNKTEEFVGWDDWKQGNKDGRSSRVLVHKTNDGFIIKTSNGGIEIENTTTIYEEGDNVYIAISGDQCVIENIHIKDI